MADQNQAELNIKARVIAKIEAALLDLAYSAVLPSDSFSQVSNSTAATRQTVSKSLLNKLRRTSLTVHVLAKIHELIQNDQLSTKRDLYYQDKDFYGSDQRVLDGVICSISNMLLEPRRNLNLLSSAKGLVFGDLQFRTKEGNVVDCLSSNSGTLLPGCVEDLCDLRSRAEFLLIIEKDATFQKLLDEEFRVRWANRCILLTGKGYPDIGTRIMAKRIQLTFNVPVFCLTDSGAYGIEIMLTYKFGGVGKSLPFESAEICIPELEWIGLLTSDIARHIIAEEQQQQLSARETKKIARLLSRDGVEEMPMLRQELIRLEQTRRKIEIQALESLGPSFLTNYVEAKIKEFL